MCFDSVQSGPEPDGDEDGLGKFNCGTGKTVNSRARYEKELGSLEGQPRQFTAKVGAGGGEEPVSFGGAHGRSVSFRYLLHRTLKIITGLP